MKRTAAVAVVLGVSSVSAGAAWIAASRITSLDDARRSAKAPEASLITVPVEQRELSANLVLRGSLSFDEAASISVPAASGEESGTRVVTKAPPDVGSDIVEGQVIAEISGRPVIVLAGALPVFRDLRSGSTGDDVEQLEQALERLGFSPGVVDGTYDAATEAAVDRLYAANGYGQKEPGKEQRDLIESARESLAEAQRTLRAAERAERTSGTPKKSAQVRLEGALDTARRRADAAITAAAKARTAEPIEIAGAQADLDNALAQRAAADAALAAAQISGAVNPESGDPFTPPEIAALQSTATSARAEVTARTKAVADARSRATEAIETADAAVLDANQAVREAFLELVESTTSGNEDEKDAVADARTALGEAMKRLAEQEAVLTGIPQAEVTFVRTLPRRVGSVSLQRGDTATGEMMTVSGSNLAVRTSVTAADRTLVRPGMSVTVAESDVDLKFSGVVASVADQAGDSDGGSDGSSGNGSDGSSGNGDDDSSDSRFAVVISPGEMPSDIDLPTLEGLSFRITIPVKSTDGEVLTVPAAALSATGDDRVRVEVHLGGKRTRFVEVTKGLAAQGYVEVAPVPGETLDKGDEVVVGR